METKYFETDAWGPTVPKIGDIVQVNMCSPPTEEMTTGVFMGKAEDNGWSERPGWFYVKLDEHRNSQGACGAVRPLEEITIINQLGGKNEL